MRLERTTKKPRSRGRTAYSSDSFSVVVWSLEEGVETTIRCHLASFLEISFDGECAFLSDDECIEQFTAEEILGVIEVQKGRAFTKGQKSKAQQIRDCLAFNTPIDTACEVRGLEANSTGAQIEAGGSVLKE